MNKKNTLILITIVASILFTSVSAHAFGLAGVLRQTLGALTVDTVPRDVTKISLIKNWLAVTTDANENPAGCTHSVYQIEPRKIDMQLAIKMLTYARQNNRKVSFTIASRACAGKPGQSVVIVTGLTVL